MPTIAHFDLPVDDPERAKKFYSELFGWKIEKVDGAFDYYFIETTDLEGQPGLGGGMGPRGSPDQRITNFVEVTSVDEYCDHVKELGGMVLQPKMPVPGWGYLAVCMDTEANTFGLWEVNENAK
ncbi:VOC family protein [Methanococcoides orientis]|uniref:VOC family protein n=1 Tax=Methanococcoides orientis TaxID=2822137 RepID=UPI001E2C65D8|nr:VOC family protein [Methanococcoides orientis]UGV41657.1 VOC family protein [Methanococcoides orientis]